MSESKWPNKITLISHLTIIASQENVRWLSPMIVIAYHRLLIGYSGALADQLMALNEYDDHKGQLELKLGRPSPGSSNKRSGENLKSMGRKKKKKKTKKKRK